MAVSNGILTIERALGGGSSNYIFSLVNSVQGGSPPPAPPSGLIIAPGGIVSAEAWGSPVVSVASGSYNPASEGNLVWQVDMQDASSYTVTGGTTVTALKNRITSVAAVTGAAAPTYSATGANGHPCLTMVAASTQNLVLAAGTDTAFTNAVAGGDRTEFHVCSFNPVGAYGTMFALGKSGGSSSASDFFGSLVSKYRNGHTSTGNVQIESHLVTIADTSLHIVRSRFDSTANLLYVSVDGGTETSVAYTQAVPTTHDRWSIGSLCTTTTDTYAGGTYAEGLVFSSFKGIGAGSACANVQAYLKAKWGTP